MGRIEFYLANLTNFGYKISKEKVEQIVKKFETNPDAKPIGGPEQFIKAWMDDKQDD